MLTAPSGLRPSPRAAHLGAQIGVKGFRITYVQYAYLGEVGGGCVDAEPTPSIGVTKSVKSGMTFNL